MVRELQEMGYWCQVLTVLGIVLQSEEESGSDLKQIHNSVYQDMLLYVGWEAMKNWWQYLFLNLSSAAIPK